MFAITHHIEHAFIYTIIPELILIKKNREGYFEATVKINFLLFFRFHFRSLPIHQIYKDISDYITLVHEVTLALNVVKRLQHRPA